MACNEDLLDPIFSREMLMEWCFPGRRLQELPSVSLWRSRSVFFILKMQACGIFLVSLLESVHGRWCVWLPWTFSWSVPPGYRCCNVAVMGMEGMEVMEGMVQRQGCRELGCVLLCSGGISSQSGTRGQHTRSDVGGQCWFYCWLCLGFLSAFLFSCALCAVGMAATQPKPAFTQQRNSKYCIKGWLLHTNPQHTHLQILSSAQFHLCQPQELNALFS